ncbi:MAG TPA: FAD-dependent oxidoreductase [Deltaproteobacteria bacterium]|jgi:NADPH-dependent 2,4-dienoyl-CoA reductase/sulfur reductase-like enzyme|nr:FAD-dependent oxidoreductase [Deltaproteobacteria bacterium]HQI00941.1 FAD-dependent oxidoreductase [Deltaproteobacteria bacterium]HQJ07463.1 FAD-dependent oxidoreductase [Deltaproteobacteria bacterium]
MAEKTYAYAIAGGGLAGASAVEGIREIDRDGSILLIGSEKELPYNRPPLTKKLWFGTETASRIFVHGRDYYENNGVDMFLGRSVTKLDPDHKTITDSEGNSYGYGKLLLVTGGTPRHLHIPGADLEGVTYYRYLDDYEAIRPQAKEGKTATVIGGGFIGSEMAAALTINRVEVTMVFPDPYLVSRVFPEDLGRALQQHFMNKGVTVLTGDKPKSFSRTDGGFLTTTDAGNRIESDILIVGIGITPNMDLAKDAGLKTGNGIIVNEYLQTSNPDIYAAGDNAFFPYQALGMSTRVEHWDNALSQGKWVGRNMAGAHLPFTYMPYFFSDLFEFGYEAVGEIDSRLNVFEDWKRQYETGIVYYLKDSRVCGVMTCDIYGKLDIARNLIRSHEKATPQRLRNAIV